MSSQRMGVQSSVVGSWTTRMQGGRSAGSDRMVSRVKMSAAARSASPIRTAMPGEGSRRGGL